MQCPVDGSDLLMSERRGVEVDYCPKCRGVWLDRGELDKVIERSESESEPAVGARPTREDPRHHGGGHPKKKPKSFLQDIFELGG